MLNFISEDYVINITGENIFDIKQKMLKKLKEEPDYNIFINPSLISIAPVSMVICWPFFSILTGASGF